MDKIKIIFYSNGKTLKETVDSGSKMFERLTDNSKGVTLWNSKKVEVYMQSTKDKRKWYLWHKYTNEVYSENN